MGILKSLIKKETIHIVRDTRTMLITLLMPIVLLLLFGFAISTEINGIRVVASADTSNDYTRAVIERLKHNDNYVFGGMVAPAEVEPLMRRGQMQAALIMRTRAGRTETQIIVDASNPTVGQAASAYVSAALAEPGTESPAPIITRTLYNPQMKSSYNFVPGIMGMIFILICAIMTSVSIVSEKERGTMDLLLVSPVRPHTIIAGKLVPYFMLSCILLALMLLLSYTVLGLPVSNTIFTVIGFTLLYVVLALSIGLLVSTLVSTQLSALMVSAVLFMLPVIMLSGMIFPIDNMPEILQWLSAIIPARWYISAMRKLMIQQLDFSYVVQEFTVLMAMTAALITLAVKNFKSKH